MNVEVFAEWLGRQGYRIIRSPSSHWYGQKTRLYNAFPSHRLIQPEHDELDNLHVYEGALILRYSKPLYRKEGKISYHIVCEAPYDMQQLSSKTRQNIRKGQKHCRIEQISLDYLATEGWLLQQDSLDRQGRLGSMAQSDWVQICRAAHDLPGFEAWGAFVEQELAATIFAVTIDDTAHLMYRNARRAFFPTRASNALSYAVSSEILSRPGMRQIFDGMHQLDSAASIDDFKLSMGYQIRPVRQRIKIHPWLTPIFNQFAYNNMQLLHRRFPQWQMLAKVEGLIHFYLDGKHLPDQQIWPEHLLSRREDVMALLRANQQADAMVIHES